MMTLELAAALLAVLAFEAHLWYRVRRLDGCVRYLIRQTEAHHADVDALAETIDEVAAERPSESWDEL